MTTLQSTEDLAGRHLTSRQRFIIYVPATILSVLAIIVGVFRPYTQGSDFGYYLGLAGGCMMVSLYLYPIRKYWQPLQRLGSLRTWFMLHIIFGMGGAVMVLFHATFQTKSVNGTVTFWATVLVIISGLIGRFVYVHMYQGMDGSHATVRDKEENLRRLAGNAQHALNRVPHVLDLLQDYSKYVFATRVFTWKSALSFLTLGWRRNRLISRCKGEIGRALKAEAQARNKPLWRFAKHKKVLFELVEDYVRAIDTTGRYAYWSGLLAWWNLIHIPLVYLLLVSGIIHVIAVHWY